MIDIDAADRRRMFSVWLRTGRLPTKQVDGIEFKFNPYHDPRNGQFTFAPGGPRSLGRVIISHRKAQPGEQSISRGGRWAAIVRDLDQNTGRLTRLERANADLI